jgi:hypothetical protein
MELLQGTRAKVEITRVAGPDLNPDPIWTRIQSGQWIRIRIQEAKNDPQKFFFYCFIDTKVGKKNKKSHVLKC